MPEPKIIEGQILVVVNYKALRQDSRGTGSLTKARFQEDAATFFALKIGESFVAGLPLEPDGDYYELDSDVTVYSNLSDLLADQREGKVNIAPCANDPFFAQMRVAASRPSDWLWAAEFSVAESTTAQRIQDGLRSNGLVTTSIKVEYGTAFVLGMANEAQTTSDIERGLTQSEGYNGIKAAKRVPYSETFLRFDLLRIPKD